MCTQYMINIEKSQITFYSLSFKKHMYVYIKFVSDYQI